MLPPGRGMAREGVAADLTGCGAARHRAAMSSATGTKPFPWVKLAVLAVAGLGLAVLLLRGLNVREVVEQLLELIRSAGPVVFFLAMAILPALGVPILTFALTAGPVFGEQLGLPLVLALSLTAVTINIVFTFFLARGAFRPLLVRVFARLGYRLPQVDPGDETGLIVIVRVTPGVPFPVQNYLLGLSGVRFARYLWISLAVTFVYQTGFVLFGDALLQGKAKVVLLAVSLLVAAAAATHLLRRRYRKKGTDA